MKKEVFFVSVFSPQSAEVQWRVIGFLHLWASPEKRGVRLPPSAFAWLARPRENPEGLLAIYHRIVVLPWIRDTPHTRSSFLAVISNKRPTFLPAGEENKLSVHGQYPTNARTHISGSGMKEMDSIFTSSLFQARHLRCVWLVVFRNTNTNKIVTNRFNRNFLDHWNTTFIVEFSRAKRAQRSTMGKKMC